MRAPADSETNYYLLDENCAICCVFTRPKALTIVPPQGSESKLVLVRFADATMSFKREEGIFAFPDNFVELSE